MKKIIYCIIITLGLFACSGCMSGPKGMTYRHIKDIRLKLFIPERLTKDSTKFNSDNNFWDSSDHYFFKDPADSNSYLDIYTDSLSRDTFPAQELMDYQAAKLSDFVDGFEVKKLQVINGKEWVVTKYKDKYENRCNYCAKIYDTGKMISVCYISNNNTNSLFNDAERSFATLKIE